MSTNQRRVLPDVQEMKVTDDSVQVHAASSQHLSPALPRLVSSPSPLYCHHLSLKPGQVSQAPHPQHLLPLPDVLLQPPDQSPPVQLASPQSLDLDDVVDSAVVPGQSAVQSLPHKVT